MRKSAAERPEAKRWRRACSEEQAEDACGDRADDEEPVEAGVVVGDLAVAEWASEPADDARPVAAEKRDWYECRREVPGDEERDEERVVLVDVPAEDEAG